MPTQILRPTGPGSQEEITSQYPASGEHWDKVDEEVADDDTTYLYSTSITSLQDTLALENHPSLTGTIVSVTAYARGYGSSPNGRGATGIKTGGTIYRSNEQVLGNFWSDLDPYQAFLNPDTGLAWTWADINNLEVLVYQRYSVGAAQQRTTQVYVKVHYLPDTVEVLRPNAAGDVCGISGQVGAACPDHYLNVDEVVPDDDTTYVFGSAWAPPPTNPSDLYNIENSGVGAGVITNVAVYGRFKDNADDRYRGATSYFWIKTGGAQYRSGGYPQLGDWSDFYRNWATNPQTGVAWTWADINALQIGLSLFNPQRASGVDWIGKNASATQMWVEVTYTPQVGGSQVIIVS